MTRARTWNLRLNLDTFNAAFAALADDTERGQFLAGLSRGVNGGVLKSGTTAMEDGFTIGKEMRVETEAYRSMKAEVGLKGGRPKHKTKGEPIGNQEETKGEPGLNPIHQPLSFNLSASSQQPKITSPTAQRTKVIPPAPLEALSFFNEHIWKKYPQRARDGKPLNKGHKPDALTRCLYIMGRWDIDWPELEAAVLRYHKHPNVLQGNVQAVEVFFGDRGHWLECWEWVRRQQQVALEM